MSFVSRTIHSRQMPHRLAAFPTAVLVLVAGIEPASGQSLPCHFEVAAVIQAPDGPISSSPTSGQAISPNGRYVVGSYRFDAVGADRAYYFDMQAKQFTPLPLLPGTYTSVGNDVNDAGQIAGHIGGTAGDWGFIYSISTGQYTLLDAIDPEGTCTVTGITSDGTVCGTRSIGTKDNPVFPKTAFKWTAEAGFVDLGIVGGYGTGAVGIAEDGGMAVAVGSGIAAYFWDGTQAFSVGTFKGGDGLTPYGVGNGGRVVGDALFVGKPSSSTAFDFHDGMLNALPALDAVHTSCVARAVSNKGLVGGNCRSPGFLNWQPCLWTATEVVNLNHQLPAGTGPFLREATDFSEAGHILCGASEAGHVISVVLTPVADVIGDTNCDQRVDVDDLILVILEWGRTDSSADVNQDQIVDVVDLSIVIQQWTFD